MSEYMFFFVCMFLMCVFVCSGSVKERLQSVVCPESVKETSHLGHQPAGSHPVRAPHHDGGSQSFHHQVRRQFYSRRLQPEIYTGVIKSARL